MYRIVEAGGRGKSFEEIQKMAQMINDKGDEDKVQGRGNAQQKKASYVYCRNGRRYTRILHGGHNDNSSTDRNKNI